jgi:hypothetical protein
LAILFCEEYNRIPSHRELVFYGDGIGIKIPKSFTKYRFSGSYKNLIKVIENKTELIYSPLAKTDLHRKKLSNANIGNFWWSCDELKISILSKKENLKDNYKWYRGRKYGNKN